jgi:hypothetical protein
MRSSWPIELSYSRHSRRFIFLGTYQDRHIPKAAGFCWDAVSRHWYTTDPKKADQLRGIANETARKMLSQMLNLECHHSVIFDSKVRCLRCAREIRALDALSE